MKMGEVIAGAAVIAFVVITFAFTSPPQTIKNDEAIPTDTHFHWMRHEQEVDQTADITHLASGDELTLHLYHDVLSTPIGTKAGGKFKINLVHDRYLWDPYFHINAFGGYFKTHGDDDAFQVGLGVSPGSLLYGTVSPNVMFTKDAIGAGLALYFPAEYVQPRYAPFFKRTGIQCGRLYSTRTGDVGNFIGISLDSFDF